MYRTSTRTHIMGTVDSDIPNNSSVFLSIEAKVSSSKTTNPFHSQMTIYCMNLHIAELTVFTLIRLFFPIANFCSTKQKGRPCSGDGFTENTFRTENKSDRMLFAALQQHYLYKNSMEIMNKPHLYQIMTLSHSYRIMTPSHS